MVYPLKCQESVVASHTPRNNHRQYGRQFLKWLPKIFTSWHSHPCMDRVLPLSTGWTLLQMNRILQSGMTLMRLGFRRLWLLSGCLILSPSSPSVSLSLLLSHSNKNNLSCHEVPCQETTKQRISRNLWSSSSWGARAWVEKPERNWIQSTIP